MLLPNVSPLRFYGQYYHTSIEKPCGLCGKGILNIYTLRPPQGQSVPVGLCCFILFKKQSPKVYTQLLAAKTLLEASMAGFKADVKENNAKGDLDFHKKEWSSLKRKATKRIQEYQKTSGGLWLPKPLFDLQEEVQKPTGKTLRWFTLHTPVLKNMLTN